MIFNEERWRQKREKKGNRKLVARTDFELERDIPKSRSEIINPRRKLIIIFNESIPENINLNESLLKCIFVEKGEKAFIQYYTFVRMNLKNHFISCTVFPLPKVLIA